VPSVSCSITDSVSGASTTPAGNRNLPCVRTLSRPGSSDSLTDVLPVCVVAVTLLPGGAVDAARFVRLPVVPGAQAPACPGLQAAPPPGSVVDHTIAVVVLAVADLGRRRSWRRAACGARSIPETHHRARSRAVPDADGAGRTELREQSRRKRSARIQAILEAARGRSERIEWPTAPPPSIVWYRTFPVKVRWS